MKWHAFSLLPALLIFATVAQGLLIIGPRKLRANRRYTMVMSNFEFLRVDISLTLTNGTSGTVYVTKTADVQRNRNQLVEFDVPDGLGAGSYTLTLKGQRGFAFHEEIEVDVVSKFFSGLIQFNKPVFRPGETVQFRVIVLDSDLKPPKNPKSVSVVIENGKGESVRKWDAAELQIGVFEGSFQIAPSPALGSYKVTVASGDEELVSKTFEVKEYVLSRFDVDVFLSTPAIEEHQGLNFTISAKNLFGKPVSGNVHLTVFTNDSLLEVKATRPVELEMTQLEMRFNKEFVIYEESGEVNLNFTFTEQYTNRSIAKSLQFTVYKTKYIAKLVKETPGFLPGKEFRATVKMEHRDGSPARFVNCKVEVDGLEDPYDKTFATDDKGDITLKFTPTANDTLSISVSVEGNNLLDETIERDQQNTEAFFKITNVTEIQLSQPIKLKVTCRQKVKFLVYYVLSKGNVIHQDFIRSNKMRFDLTLKYSDNMVPKAKVLVVTVANNTVVYGIKDIVFPGLLNNLEMEMEDNEVKPGQQIQLEIVARPASYVALAAYDKSLLKYGSTHDLYYSDVQQLYESFHQIDENEFDVFQSYGLFAKISDNLSMDQAMGIGRYEHVQKKVETRANFAESFLWRSATLDRSGRLTLVDYTPETTTAWCLTGFSMHPMYGLGIIKAPLQFSTVKAFYIVDHLPYSIKRGEVVTLQFTIFNNLGADFITEVTLENVQDQMEFVEQPTSTLAHSKLLTVKQAVAVPISFLVKAKKLGEMVVHVKASNMLEIDAVEKVIRVLPESLVEKRMESHLFCHDKHLSMSFTYKLNFDEKAVPGSQRITFTVNPNFLTTVASDLGELLSVPIGCGEQNMIRFVPNVVVLDYLKATKSNDTKLKEKATGFLREGYQNQMRYRQTDGSFGVWQTGGGSVFLTAFVAKSMQTAAKHIRDVDVTMVAKAFQWLASKQRSSGRFEEVGEVIDYDMQGGLRNGVALTSYVLIAFMEHEEAKVTHADVIATGIEYVASMLSHVSDLYDLSIATYALMLNNHSQSEFYYEMLVDRSTINGTMRYWAREPHRIETTAYALLAMVQAGKYLDGIPVMFWLANQRYVTGGFPRTQDTFVGLKALTKVVEKISPSGNDYTVNLMYKRKEHIFTMTPSNVAAQTFENIPGDVREITTNVAGVGFGLLDVKYEYSLDLRNYSQRFDLKLQKLNTNSDDKLQLNICASFIQQSTMIRSNMALVEVNFPSGYVVDNNPISEATTANPIKNIEIRFGGTSVVVYYNNMGTERNCFLITAYRRFKVSLKRPAYVLVHDYYDPRFNAIQVYELDPRDE